MLEANKIRNSSGGGRIYYLDALKCLGILLVIEGHVRQFGMGIQTYETLSGLMLYSFNMPIFFFVSGFLAYRTLFWTIRETLKRTCQKFVSLVIPAVIFYVFHQLICYANPLDLFTNGAGGYWFTITLFECFVIYYIVRLLFKKDIFQDVVLIGLALAGIVLLSVYGEFGPKLLDLNRLTKYFQFFVMGVLAMKYKNQYEQIIHSEWLKTLTIIGFFAILFTINRGFWPESVFHMMRDVVLRYLGTFIVVSWFVCHSDRFDANNKINRMGLDIGKKSLAIYLLQYFFIPDFNAYITWLSGMDGFTVHVISFAYTAVIVIVCYIFTSLLSNSLLLKKYLLGQK